jgi:signal transduction histidine kinase
MLKSLLRFAFKTTRKGPLILTAYSEAQDVILRLEIPPAGSLPAELVDLFELMVTTDATGRTALSPGGLDLPLVRYLVEKQRGRVWAESHSNTLVIFLGLPEYELTTEP